MPLRQADVLEAAVALLEEVGLDELSTRKLADRLGVRPGALYWHYASKQALLDAVAEKDLARLAAKLPAGGDWDVQLRAFAEGLRATMLARRDGARLITTMNELSPSIRDGFMRMVEVLRAAGATFEQAAAGVDAVTSFVNGYTMEEQARKVGRLPAELLEAGFQAELRIILSGIRTEVF
jgi:TetR/AcrR family tetracycline transcriptional repressor